MRNRLCATARFVFVAALAFAAPARAADAHPPQDLVRLEKAVGLRVAHVRDQGPVDSEQRRKFLQAQSEDQSGEAALKAGDLDGARSHFLAAKAFLDELGI